MRRARKDGLRRVKVKAGRVVAEASWFDYVIRRILAPDVRLHTVFFSSQPKPFMLRIGRPSVHSGPHSRAIIVYVQLSRRVLHSADDRVTVQHGPTVRVPVSAGLEALAGRSRIGDVAGTFMCS